MMHESQKGNLIKLTFVSHALRHPLSQQAMTLFPIPFRARRRRMRRVKRVPHCAFPYFMGKHLRAILTVNHCSQQGSAFNISLSNELKEKHYPHAVANSYLNPSPQRAFYKCKKRGKRCNK